MTLDELKGKVSALETKVANWFKGTKATEGTEKTEGAEGDDAAPTIEGLGASLSALEARFTQLNGDLATANQTITTLTTAKTTLEGQVTALTNDKAQLTTKVTELEGKLNNPEGTIQTEAGKKAKNIVAGQGVPVDQLPAGQENGGGTDAKAKAEKHYMKLIEEGKSLEAGQFWKENRELLK
jgi:hypothetical protein